jgi:hypothetical protein
VDLGHRGVQLGRRRWDERHLERAGGHHHPPGPVGGIGGPDLEASVVQPPELVDLGVELDRQVEGLGVGLQVVGHRVLGRVGVVRGRERDAGQGVVLGRCEQLERVPPGSPDVADFGAGFQDQELQALLS